MAGTLQERSKKTPIPLESSLVKRIIDYLNSLEGCRAIKTHGNARRSGEPDVLVCYRGRMLQLEVKRPGGKPTKLQIETLAKWSKVGAVAEVVTSVDEVKEIIKLLNGEDCV